MKLKTSRFLQLRDFKIERFKVEENINGAKKFVLNADFVPIETKDKEKKQRGFIFELKVNERVKGAALKAEIKLALLFETDENLTEDKQTMLILNNGLSIAYGMARGMIFQACSVLPPNAKLLPSVNIKEFIKDKVKMQREKEGF
jgi:hypothetical protein